MYTNVYNNNMLTVSNRLFRGFMRFIILKSIKIFSMFCNQVDKNVGF